MPMDNSFVNRMRTLIENGLIARRHTALLVAIIALLGVRPLISDTGVGTAMYSISPG
jgi:hypothetical protein